MKMLFRVAVVGLLAILLIETFWIIGRAMQSAEAASSITMAERLGVSRSWYEGTLTHFKSGGLSKEEIDKGLLYSQRELSRCPNAEWRKASCEPALRSIIQYGVKGGLGDFIERHAPTAAIKQ